MRLREANARTDQLDVQEGNCGLTQFHISLDAGLRMDGITAFDVWDPVIEGSNPSPKGDRALGDMMEKEYETHPIERAKPKRLMLEASCLREIDYVPLNVKLCRHNAFVQHF